MAPVMIMHRNSAVMIPVILYKIIIATAVIGEGPIRFWEGDKPLFGLPLGAFTTFGSGLLLLTVDMSGTILV